MMSRLPNSPDISHGISINLEHCFKTLLPVGLQRIIPLNCSLIITSSLACRTHSAKTVRKLSLFKLRCFVSKQKYVVYLRYPLVWINFGRKTLITTAFSAWIIFRIGSLHRCESCVVAANCGFRAGIHHNEVNMIASSDVSKYFVCENDCKSVTVFKRQKM